MKPDYAQLTALAATIAVLAATTPVSMPTGNRWPGEASMVVAASGSNVERGDRLTAERRFGAAREAYAAAAELVRSQGGLPVKAVRRIANSYYFEASYNDAAATLDALAEEAASFGDLEAQAWAAADAAWLAWLGNSDRVGERIERLEAILATPELSSEVRERIEEDLMGDLVVFAPHLDSW